MKAMSFYPCAKGHIGSVILPVAARPVHRTRPDAEAQGPQI